MILCALPIAFMSAFYGERLIRDRAGGMRVHLFVSAQAGAVLYWQLWRGFSCISASCHPHAHSACVLPF